MEPRNLPALLDSLLAFGREAEWIEFKQDRPVPDEIGEYISALSNGAALHHQDYGYIVWGIEDGSLRVFGTTFQPRRTKVGNEDLENWLVRLLEPRIHFVIHEFEYDGKPIVLIQIERCPHRPVAFRATPR